MNVNSIYITNFKFSDYIYSIPIICQIFNNCPNSNLYQAWILCPFLPQLFRVWPLQGVSSSTQGSSLLASYDCKKVIAEEKSYYGCTFLLFFAQPVESTQFLMIFPFLGYYRGEQNRSSTIFFILSIKMKRTNLSKFELKNYICLYKKVLSHLNAFSCH